VPSSGFGVSEHIPKASVVSNVISGGTGSKRLKVALVTSFPPSRGDLNEYGFHIASALRSDPGIDLTILADLIDSPEELPGFQIDRRWRFNSFFNPFYLLSAIRECDPDVVWFNLGFSTFARSPLAAFLGITVPALARVLGYYTHVTLHTVFERISLEDAGLRFPEVYRMAGRVATRMILAADDVSVLLPSFRSELVKNYGSRAFHVKARPHGTFEGVRMLPEVSRSNNSKPSILAFGYWGTYKRVDLLLETMNEVSRCVPGAELIIAGTNHPSTPRYLESLQERYRHNDGIVFLGYVPEDELPALFRNASVLVLPYSSAAGTSGVVHQACQFGLPMVAAEVPEIVEIAKEEHIAIDFYPQGDGAGLANHLVRLLTSDELRRQCREQNLAAAQGTPMSQVVGEYVRLFRERVQHSKR
jgi:glycosyltransferase involved in cell wall biosynthesis